MPLTKIPLTELDSAADNLRTEMTDIESLAQSILHMGLIEPIRVEKRDGRYRIIAGHRRLEAHRLLAKDHAEYREIEAVVGTQVTDDDRTVAMLIENTQRVDLDPLEQAEGMVRLVQEHGWKQQDVAKALGFSKAHVSKRIKLLNLTPHMRNLTREKKLTLEQAETVSGWPEDVQHEFDQRYLTPYDLQSVTRRLDTEALVKKQTTALNKMGFLVIAEDTIPDYIEGELADFDTWGQSVYLYLQTWKEHGSKQVMGRTYMNGIDVLDEAAGLTGKNHLFVSSWNNGHHTWWLYPYEAIIDDDEEEDEANLTQEQIDERASREKYDLELDAYNAEVARITTEYLDQKPAELLKKAAFAFITVNEHNNQRVCEMLGIDIEDTTPTGAVLAFAQKSAGNLAQAFAANMMQNWSYKKDLVVLPERPVFERNYRYDLDGNRIEDAEDAAA